MRSEIRLSAHRLDALVRKTKTAGIAISRLVYVPPSAGTTRVAGDAYDFAAVQHSASLRSHQFDTEAAPTLKFEQIRKSTYKSRKTGVAAMCPSRFCQATKREQRGLTQPEIERLGNPPWASVAQVCTHCGTLYSFKEPPWLGVEIHPPLSESPG